MRPALRAALVVVATAFTFAGGCALRQPAIQPGTEYVAAQTRPVSLDPADPRRERIGWLRYMGGLHIQSPDQRFGGLSGLRWAGGRLYAVSDAGDWFGMALDEAGGRLRGIKAIDVTRLTGADGKPLTGKRAGDAEAFTFGYGDCKGAGCQPETVLIAFEQDHRLWSYTFSQGRPKSSPISLALPQKWLQALPSNSGMETVAGDPASGLFIFPEGERDGSADAQGLWRDAKTVSQPTGPEDATHWRPISLPVFDGFQPTDADMLGDGRLVLVYRHYSLMRGVAARIAVGRIEEGSLGAGRRQVIIERWVELSPPYSVDNMEGLAVREEQGKHYLYLVSDDNFSGAQRTLLMKFEMLARQ